MIGDCQFTPTSGGTTNWALIAGTSPISNPTQALSDVTAILSLTTPNNERCDFPYTYTPGNWQMYFCRRNFNTSYTCPTTSGQPGQCVAGKFANIKAQGTGGFDQTYATDVKQSASTTQCLDFYYYIPGASNNPKIQVGWKVGEDTQQIIELTPLPENKWHNRRSSFTAPSSSSYQLTFRMIRDGTSTTHYFGLDEIKIYDQSCESIVTTITAARTSSITMTVSATSGSPQSPVVTQGTEETQSTTVSTVTMTTSTSTTEEPLIRLFNCDFSASSCFANSELLIRNGSEFTSVDIISEPPRFPLSDVTSINETCDIPYRPLIDNSTNTTSWDLNFCYMNQCPTKNQVLANCTLGNYGLITIGAWESDKTIVESINEGMMIQKSVEERCLLYWYYITVYDQLDWGQRISVLIKSDNEIEIDQVSAVDMVENRWYSRNVTFNAPFMNYTLMFHFEVTNGNRTFDPALNKTIYFALDSIEVYNRNCRSVFGPPIGSTSTSPSPATVTTTKPDDATAAPPSSSNNLGLGLGLSLGLGIPALLLIIG
ncbi:unnamed protein product, partial [Rotaria sp. Silwood1]